MAPHLAESTRAKVSVLTSPAAAAEELQRHLGAEFVPAEFGGRCMCSLEDMPAHKGMLDLIAALRSGNSSGSANCNGGSAGRVSSGSGGSVEGERANACNAP